MKKQRIAIVALFLLGLVAVGDAFADRGHGRGGHGYGHGRVGVGIVVGAPFWRPGYYQPYYYPPYPSYYPPIVIERQAPPVYIEQPPLVESSPQAGYWYYCQSLNRYYPEIRECPKGWLKIPPRP